MLDAATELVFEAYAEKMAAQSTSFHVPPSKQIVQHSPSLLQDFELASKVSPQNTTSSSPIQPQMQRKRRRTGEHPDFQHLVDANHTSLGLIDKNPYNVGAVSEQVEKSVDFSKAIEVAISRIESLIPSLQNLVKPTHSSEQNSVVNLGLPNIFSAVKPTGQDKDKDRVITTNEFCDKLVAQPTSQMLTKHNFPARSQVKWRKNTEYVESETTQESDLPSSSSESYESVGSDSYISDESVPLHENVGRSFTENPNSTSLDYDDTSSYYNSLDEYLDEYSNAGSLSQMSLDLGCKWDSQREQGKKSGRLKRIGRKLGMIFHHHHHHHHHHYRDKPDMRHARSFWKRFGAMFHHTGNANHRHNLKDEKPKKYEIKTLVKRKKQGGHFHALLGGLMKHMKHSKPEQVKNGIKGLGSGRNGGMKEGKKLTWWPKIRGGRGGVKVFNKGKIRLGNYRTKSFVAAKMILKK